MSSSQYKTVVTKLCQAFDGESHRNCKNFELAAPSTYTVGNMNITKLTGAPVIKPFGACSLLKVDN